MAAQTQDIIYNVTGQTLVWDPPEGRVASVTSVAVYLIGTGDDGSAEAATTGSASIDAVNTVLDAASGDGESNRRKINLTATTNIAIGRTYLVSSLANAEKEFVIVEGIATGDYVLSAEPLRNGYAIADSFYGLRLSIDVDSTWVADESNISDDGNPAPGYRVRWEYVVGSTTYVHDAYFDLVRYPGKHSLVPPDMLNIVPNWFDRLPTYHQEDQGRRLLDQAYTDVRWDMYRSGHADEMIRHAAAVDRLTQLKAWVLLERDGNEVQQALSLEAYNAEMDGLIRVVTTVPEGTDTSGAGDDTTAAALWSK